MEIVHTLKTMGQSSPLAAKQTIEPSSPLSSGQIKGQSSPLAARQTMEPSSPLSSGQIRGQSGPLASGT